LVELDYHELFAQPGLGPRSSQSQHLR
jgi:hypothetical protein